MMAAHFEGRVSHFITLNEPQIVLKLGYADGIHAPGKRLSSRRRSWSMAMPFS
ncbi:MAG: family 1 glycosylhydrolase [Oscillospiraceae bacterium]